MYIQLTAVLLFCLTKINNFYIIKYLFAIIIMFGIIRFVLHIYHNLYCIITLCYCNNQYSHIIVLIGLLVLP